MEKITRQGRANASAERYEEQYSGAILQGGGYKQFDPAKVLQALRSLGPTPDPEDVDRVIGNDSWTFLSCNECGEKAQVVLRLGDPPDYESSTVELCFPCIIKAAALMASQ